MNIPFSPPDLSQPEINAVVDVLESGWITTGPKTKEFERQISEYIGTEKTACLSSATASMEMTLRLLGIGEGDEVIVPAYTYTASCSVICHVGAVPVMVDIQPGKPFIDYGLLDGVISDKTKAIIAVDLAGIICDYEKIYAIIERHKDKFTVNGANPIQRALGRIAVIADSSHGFGAVRNGVRSGAHADFTCFSFHAVKNLTTAEGGAVTWKNIDGIDNELIYKEYMNLSLHGQTKDALNKTKAGSWEYDIVSPAYKCNMTDIQAAIGLEQMKRYDDMLKRRHEIIAAYDEAFEDMPLERLPHFGKDHRSSGHLYFIRPIGISEDIRNEIIIKLAEKGISSNVHYKPLPMLTAYKNLGFNIQDYPHSYNYYKNEITLPLYSKLTDEQVKYVINGVKDIMRVFR
ncbi:MAG: DegT/DnrJ/EryC1/StrS family aminotransferase [Anaerovoracaceae bacterium]|nr:DegT/DnrJ/EryC1/StrS family aminotransferase [Anaerovoracaceae bacterium]